MWQTLVLSLLAGVMGGNAIPHFVKGITRERYPTALGNSPVTNFVVGWVALLITTGLAYWAEPGRHPFGAFAGAAVGVLLIGLFHAGPGAFGRRETPAPDAS